MNRMTCETASEKLLEACGEGRQASPALCAHLEECAGCAELWREQRELDASLRMLRARAAGQRSPEFMRASLLHEFALRQESAGGKRMSRRWLWSVAAAAVFVVGAVMVRDVARQPVGTAQEMVSEETDPQEEGFIDVPFAPPLAQGEMVRVVHTALQPAALASMGVNVDPSWTTELPADVLVGQDGFPRAVRVSDESSADNGS